MTKKTTIQDFSEDRNALIWMTTEMTPGKVYNLKGKRRDAIRFLVEWSHIQIPTESTLGYKYYYVFGKDYYTILKLSCSFTIPKKTEKYSKKETGRAGQLFLIMNTDKNNNEQLLKQHSKEAE